MSSPIALSLPSVTASVFLFLSFTPAFLKKCFYALKNGVDFLIRPPINIHQFSRKLKANQYSYRFIDSIAVLNVGLKE